MISNKSSGAGHAGSAGLRAIWPGMRTLLRVIGVLAPLSGLLWLWAGGSAAAQCTVACCVVTPFAAGGLGCLAVGSVSRAFRAGGPKMPARMDVPILGGMALGIAAGCIITPYVCCTFCMAYGMDMSVSPCHAVLPGLVFAAISSAIVFVVAIGEEVPAG